MLGRTSQAALLASLAGVKLLLHLATHHRYGYERDELYFIACARRLAWGYVDHPPFVPWLASLSGEFFDYSLFGLRLFPIVALSLAGLWWYLFSADGKRYRTLGWIFVVTIAVLLAAKSKIYYLAPAFPMLLAAGAVAIERWIARPQGAWLRFAIPSLLTAGGLAFLPLALPILPIDTLDRLIPRVTLGVIEDPFPLTEHFHKEFGWENQAAVVAGVYHGLPEADRARAAILAGNYGEAGAIDFFGLRHGLPQAISGHHSYYLWGPRSATGEVVIAFGVPRETLETIFARIEEVARIQHPHALPLERNLPVYLCKEPRMSLTAAWPLLRRFVRIN